MKDSIIFLIGIIMLLGWCIGAYIVQAKFDVTLPEGFIIIFLVFSIVAYIVDNLIILIKWLSKKQ